MTRLKIAACIAALVVTTGAAVAQNYANIVVGGDIVARIRTGGPHGGIYQRQARIDQRITNALSNELDNIFIIREDPEDDGPDLDVAQVDGRWTLSIGNQMLLQAFPADAAGAGTDTKTLIYQWKENFFRSLPKAPSPKDVPAIWQQRHPRTVEIEKKMHDLPREDAVLVREVAEILEATREMTDEQFELLLPAMQRALLQRVWHYRHPNCGPPPISEHIRAKSALKRARGLSPEQYAAEKWWMAGLTIKKLRDAMDMPTGIGPVPEQRDLPDFEAPTPPADGGGVASDPAPADPVTTGTAPVGEPQLVAGTPIQRVAVGTGLGRDNTLLNVGQQFTADTSQLLIYLQVDDAPRNTIVGVTLHNEDGIIARRLVRVSGDRRMAVTFYPTRADLFAPGDYDVKLAVNGQDAGEVPFRIAAQ